MKKLSVIHPFLFAIFPILFLFAYNIDEVPTIDLFLPILIAIAGTLIIFFALRFITRNYGKSGIITSWLLALFFSYGHISKIVTPIAGYVKGTLILGCLWVLLFVAVAFLVIKSRNNFVSFTKFLNVVALALVVISLINVGIYEIKTTSPAQDKNGEEAISVNINTSDNLPDIYYIIVDSYARESTLEELFNYDNSEFIDYLTDKGFYVASQSRTNYAHSALSVTSSLNMEYIHDPQDGGGAKLPGISMGNNNVARFLKAMGYRCIFVSAGFFSKEYWSKYADVYLPQQGAFGIGMTNFAVGIIQTTALEPFRSLTGGDARNDMLYVFDTLADMPDIRGHKFVVAHMLGIHTPFVFDRDGNPATGVAIKATDVSQYYEEGYVEQLIFVNKKLKELIDEIMLKSEVEPIIILQADHGPGSTQQGEIPYNELTKIQIDERMNILNAYFLPDNGSHLLYQSITPVNSYRLILNHYFDANYDLLKDKSYYSRPGYPFFLVPPEESNAER